PCPSARAAAPSATITRARTAPLASPPRRSRAWRSASLIAPVPVSVRSIIIAAAPPALGSLVSQPPPGPSVPGHQRLRAGRAGGPGRVLVRFAVLGPELLDWVEHLPRQLDLPVAGEQRRVADQHIPPQPPPGFGTVLREPPPPGERPVPIPH